MLILVAALSVALAVGPVFRGRADASQAADVGSHQRSSCEPSIRVIGARGSGEDYNRNQFNMGDTVDDAFREYSRQLKGSGRTVTGEGVTYPARDVKVILTDRDKYFGGLDEGVDSLVKRVRDTGGCDRFVLVGYSQGAMVVHRAVWRLADLKFDLNRIDGVIAIADGDRKPSSGVREHGTVQGGEGISHMFKNDSGKKYKVATGVPKPLAGKVHSVCLDFDIVCDTAKKHFAEPFFTAGFKNHEKYKEGKPAWGAVKSAVSAVAGVTKSIPVVTLPPPTSPPTSSPSPTATPTLTPDGTPLTVGQLTLTYRSPWTDVGYGAEGFGGDSHATDPTNVGGATSLLAIAGPTNCYADRASCVVTNTQSVSVGPAVPVTVGGRSPDSSARFVDGRGAENMVWCFSSGNVCLLYRPQGAWPGPLSPSAALTQLFADGRWS